MKVLIIERTWDSFDWRLFTYTMHLHANTQALTLCILVKYKCVFGVIASGSTHFTHFIESKTRGGVRIVALSISSHEQAQ